MKVYRIKHLPTGLFYIPTTGRYDRTNLSKNGKIYPNKMPTTDNIDHFIRINQKQRELFKPERLCFSQNQAAIKFIADDWEVIEYELREVFE